MKQRHSLTKPVFITATLLAAVGIDTRTQNWETILDKASQLHLWYSPAARASQPERLFTFPERFAPPTSM